MPSHHALSEIQDESRIGIFDAVRGLAILLVLFFSLTLLPSPEGWEGWEQLGSLGARVDAITARIGEAAWIGADLFFVLSGFLITGVLLEAKKEQNYFRTFFVRRALRILPLYYVVLALYLVVLPKVGAQWAEAYAGIAGEDAFYWLFLSNMSVAHAQAFRHGVLDISWTLAIEVQFYLLWPFYVYYMNRTALRVACLAIIVGAFGFRMFSGIEGVPMFVVGHARMDTLAVGALVGTLRGRHLSFRDLSHLARPLLYGGLGVLFASAIFLDGLQWSGAMMQGAGYTILALAFGGLIVLCASEADAEMSPLTRGLNNGFLRTLGKYSFGLYLLHVPMRMLVERFYGLEDFFEWNGSKLPGQLLFYVLAGAASFVAAFLSWHLFEKRVLALKRFVPRLLKPEELGEIDQYTEMIALPDERKRRRVA